MWFLIGYDKVVALLASVGLEWIFISLVSHRFSNNIDNGDDDLRFPVCQGIVQGPLDRLETKNGVHHFQPLASSNPQQGSKGHLSLSIEPNKRREAIWLYSKTTRTCENRAPQGLYELPVGKEARREALTALRRGHNS
jgi:hypothetical protein